MAIEITVPRLGWNMEQGTFLGWLKNDGDSVRPGEPLFSLEGDKAAQDIEAVDSGILRIATNGPRTGETVAVGAVIGHLHTTTASPAQPDPPAGPAIRRLARQQGIDLAQVQGSGPSGRITADDVRAYPPPDAPVRQRQRISPRARRAAAGLGIDPTQISGTGLTGRVRERDVLAHAATSARAPSMAAAPISNTRRVIAERLLHSLRNTAPVTLTTTADATNLVNLRQQFQKALPAGPVPSFTDFLVKLTALTLLKHPTLCQQWQGDAIVQDQEVHIGIAVDAPTGLFVPVLRNAAHESLRALSAQSRELIDKARQGRLTAAEMQGGTFTITNLGTLGIDAFTPIIHYPQAAILGVGRIHKVAVVVDNQIAPRDQFTLSLTFDHRINDGAPAARFLQDLVAAIENPAAYLVG